MRNTEEKIKKNLGLSCNGACSEVRNKTTAAFSDMWLKCTLLEDTK